MLQTKHMQPNTDPDSKKKILLIAGVAAIVLILVVVIVFVLRARGSGTATIPMSPDTTPGALELADDVMPGEDDAMKEPQKEVIRVFDSDGDGIIDQEEIEGWRTNPNDADTDGDGINDYDEVKVFGTDPNNSDSDGDGYSDHTELGNGYDPLAQ